MAKNGICTAGIVCGWMVIGTGTIGVFNPKMVAQEPRLVAVMLMATGLIMILALLLLLSGSK
jgi:hypothetical protein